MSELNMLSYVTHYLNQLELSEVDEQVDQQLNKPPHKYLVPAAVLFG
jgi:hypothetical protein